MRRSLIRACLVAAASLTLPAGLGSAATPSSTSISVTLTNRGPVLRGPTTWHSGLVRIAASSRLPDQEVTLLHFRPGYTYADFLADGKKAQGHGAAARAAVAHVFAHTIFDGGLDLFRGQSASFMIAAEPGTYYLGEMTSPPQLVRIHVAGAHSQATVRSAATITATNGGFRVQGNPPADGTMTFANQSSRPHRFNLIPVKRSTTRAQLLAYIRKHGDSASAPPPPFALKGPQIGTADLSPKQRMQLSYRLPPGTYAAIDLDQDMQNGHPEALEGLATIVTLR
jgi:hypothetical protein